ncbi:TetR/AcrR family transcriptional regulator [Pseudooceanicola batsensis]|nr:TetR family transcriptional regulator [Pseudooceanicola batsensis]
MQERARRTRNKILDGLVRVLVDNGPAAVTHRSVASAAGVSLAATTRYFATKDAIIEGLSARTMEGYLSDLTRLMQRMRDGERTGISTLDDLVMQVVLNGLTRDRDHSIAWCELILLGARSSSGRELARDWYDEADRIWQAIGDMLETSTRPRCITPTVDRAVGLLFMLHPLAPTREEARRILAGESKLSEHGLVREDDNDDPGSEPRGTKRDLINVAIDLLVREGPSAVTYQAVSQSAGLSRGAPSYHFPTVESLMEAAQLALFRRAKTRYRDAFKEFHADRMDPDVLADLTTAIFFSEAMVHNEENLAFYSVWVRSAERSALRPPVLKALSDQQESWGRTLGQMTDQPPNTFAAMQLQALFLGKLLRAISTASSVGEIARARGHFAMALADLRGACEE